MNYSVIYYESKKGVCSTKDFLDSLPIKAQAKSLKWFEKLEEYGPDLPRPFADVLERKIRELRVIFASNNCRYLYFFHKKYAVITHGFLKKSDKVPVKEIDKAVKFMNDFNLQIKERRIIL